jgi:hypothetical protein
VCGEVQWFCVGGCLVVVVVWCDLCFSCCVAPAPASSICAWCYVGARLLPPPPPRFMCSDKVLPLVHQLCLANESEGGGVIVVLSDREKPEIEHDITTSAIDFRGSMWV